MCVKENIPIIYIRLNSDFRYADTLRSLERMRFQDRAAISVDELHNEKLELNFNYSTKIQLWQTQEIWDQREFIALNMQPAEDHNNDVFVDFAHPHYYIDSRDWWFNGRNKIKEILSFLKLELDQDRFNQWLPIYLQWQEQQIKILRFIWNADYICKAIKDNHYLDLSEYNLDLMQEATIQHIMIYQYGLNFKTWQLRKFPTNTQALHQLLEPNIHIL